MEIYFLLCGENVGMIDPTIAVCYSRNAGLALDADLALMVEHRAHRRASVLEYGAY